MGWLGSERLFDRGKSTGTKNRASAEYSVSGNWDRIRFLGRGKTAGTNSSVATACSSPIEGSSLWPQRRKLTEGVSWHVRLARLYAFFRKSLSYMQHRGAIRPGPAT